MATETEFNTNTCYICFSDEGQLLRPCTNEKCSARVHADCMKKQCETTTGPISCGICKSDVIIITKKYKFRKNKCISSYLKFIYILIMIGAAPFSIYVLSFGKSEWSQNQTNNTLGCNNFALSFFAAIPFCIFFIQMPLFCTKGTMFNYHVFHHNYFKTLKYKPYITMACLYIISAVFVFMAHCIGYGILKRFYGYPIFFTCETSLAGYCLYGVILCVCMVVVIIRHIYFITMHYFSESEFSVDMEIVNEQTKLM